jgi:hypothetical protein
LKRNKPGAAPFQLVNMRINLLVIYNLLVALKTINKEEINETEYLQDL